MILSNVNRPLLDKIYPKIMELLKTRSQLFQKQFLVHVIILCTGPTTLFHKTNSKEAISMWPDMHSFYQIHAFGPIVFFLSSLRKIDHVLRFTNFTDSDCSTFYQFHKFGNRRIKNEPRESFWFVVLRNSQIRAKIGPNL